LEIGQVYPRRRKKNSIMNKMFSRFSKLKSMKKSSCERIFNIVIQDYNLEVIYFREVLPSILLSGKWNQKSEFIQSSGLDPVRIEEIEKLYCQKNNLAKDYIKRISKSQNFSKSTI